MAPSMGSIGDCYDNGMIESFWGRMQTELLNRRRRRTRIETVAGAAGRRPRPPHTCARSPPPTPTAPCSSTASTASPSGKPASTQRRSNAWPPKRPPQRMPQLDL
ncbi:integrase core domain-containing protein [Micromonospora coerulea]|uniref:integrase core domain-containing protein n=1 Tax=Micromonospora coerulea TaxID=47856 RepID=UPI003555E207